MLVIYLTFIFSIPGIIQNKIKQKNYVAQKTVTLTQTKQENNHNTIYTDYTAIIVQTTTFATDEAELNQTELIY
jgi:hypothetical protein